MRIWPRLPQNDPKLFPFPFSATSIYDAPLFGFCLANKHTEDAMPWHCASPLRYAYEQERSKHSSILRLQPWTMVPDDLVRLMFNVEIWFSTDNATFYKGLEDARRTHSQTPPPIGTCMRLICTKHSH